MQLHPLAEAAGRESINFVARPLAWILNNDTLITYCAVRLNIFSITTHFCSGVDCGKSC